MHALKAAELENQLPKRGAAIVLEPGSTVDAVVTCTIADGPPIAKTPNSTVYKAYVEGQRSDAKI